MPRYQFTGTAETVYPYAPGGPLTVSPGDVVELAEDYDAVGLEPTEEPVTEPDEAQDAPEDDPADEPDPVPDIAGGDL